MAFRLTRQDDCYYSEFEALVGAIDGIGSAEAILSSYADAVETYKLVRLLLVFLSRRADSIDVGHHFGRRESVPITQGAVARHL